MKDTIISYLEGENNFPLWAGTSVLSTALTIITSYVFYLGASEVASLGRTSILIACYFFILGALISLFHTVKRGQAEYNVGNWALVSLILPLTVGFFLSIVSFLTVSTFSQVFRALVLDYYSTGALIILISLFVASLIGLLVRSLNVFIALKFSAALSLTGFIFAALINGDKVWWKGSICGLGMAANGAPFIFNLTAIFVALMMTMIGVLFAPSITNLRVKKVFTYTNVMALTAAYSAAIFSLTIVGLIPYGGSSLQNYVHMFAGNSLFVIFSITLILVPLIAPNLNNTFYRKSYTLLLFEVLIFALYRGTYLTISFFEINSIILMYIWLTIFIRETNLIAQSGHDKATV